MRLNAGGLSKLVIGREDEITTLESYIKFSQHTVITAPRRYGKTTLATKVLDGMSKDYLIVKVDVFEATNIEELCLNYLNAIYKSIGIVDFAKTVKESVFMLLEKFSLSYEQDGIKLGYEISKEKNIDELVKKTFNFSDKFAKLFNKKMIVFFDEFGDIEKFGEDFLKKLRSYMQTHENVVYMFAGSQTSVINSIFLNHKNAFFNFASLMNIGYLEEKSTMKFLKELKIEQKELNPDVVAKLLSITKCHPFYLIKTIQETYISSLINNTKEIRVEDVDNAIQKILSDNNAYFENIWHTLNAKKYKGTIFKSICNNKKLSININPSYKSQLNKELKMESLISEDLSITDPFLCIWLKGVQND